MDRLESLGTQLSQMTLYDIKSMYNQAKNVVFNVSEMEAKVTEATNDEAWGASSTLMQEIAQGTFNFQQFNEIMPCIYARFMEKEARQWRQIYKALQLLEYVIKHGSERVVDDARSHLSTIKMLRNFHYIDEKGKDQGINVRNRSNELATLLSDLEKIRQERRKAKSNRNKYTGVGNDGLSFASEGGGRYGGFGSDSLEGGGGGSYSNGGGYDRDYSRGGGAASGSGSGSSNFDSGKRGYEEYNAGDWDDSPRRSNSLSANRATTTRQPAASASALGRKQLREETARETAKDAVKEKEKEKSKELNIFGDDPWGDDVPVPVPVVPSKAPATTQAPAADDFGDFATAPISPTSGGNEDLFDFLTPTPAAAPVVPTVAPIHSAFAPQLNAQPQRVAPAPSNVPQGSFMSPTVMSPVSGGGSRMGPGAPASGTQKPAASANFDDLWSMSLGGPAKSTTTGTSAQKSIKDLEREKAQASIWGASSSKAVSGSGFGGGGDDLLL